MRNVQRQLQNRKVHAFSVNQKGGLEETDINEIIGKVQSVLPLLLRSKSDIGVKTFSKKDPKILADRAVMVDALLSLVRSALSDETYSIAEPLDGVQPTMVVDYAVF